MTERELALRRTIFEAFAATGAPPSVADRATLRSLAERHVVVLDERDRIVMAHPFAAHDDGRASRPTAGSGAAAVRGMRSASSQRSACATRSSPTRAASA